MRLVVMASGAGSTFEYIVRKNKEQSEPFEIVALITDNPEAKALERAKDLNILTQVVSYKDFANPEEWDEKLAECLMTLQPDWICLAGFLKKIGPCVIQKFPNQILNTHPALLPKYGGAGMYGRKVHEAVWSAQESETGVTIHFVDSHFDTGPVLAQKKVSCAGARSAKEIEERVKSIEKVFLFEQLKKLSLQSSINKSHES